MSTYSEKLRDPRWQKKRLQILNRDNFTCQWCQDTESTLHIHHLKYKGDPWDIEDEFLITLCETCHQYIDEDYHGAGAKLIAAFKSKAFASEHLLKLSDAVKKGCLTGIPFEPTIDIISFIFSDEESFNFVKGRFNDFIHEKVKQTQDGRS